jgi:hypothetical protein
MKILNNYNKYQNPKKSLNSKILPPPEGAPVPVSVGGGVGSTVVVLFPAVGVVVVPVPVEPVPEEPAPEVPVPVPEFSIMFVVLVIFVSLFPPEEEEDFFLDDEAAALYATIGIKM